MAKASKKGTSSASGRKTTRDSRIKKTHLLATASAASFPINVNVTFTSALGQATVVLFRAGAIINMQTISLSQTVVFTDGESRDSIAINGECAGDATVSINVPTEPATPKSFDKIILGSFLIL